MSDRGVSPGVGPDFGVEDFAQVQHSASRWGQVQTVRYDLNDQNRVVLVLLHLDVPQSVQVCCLPDTGGNAIRYWICYGCGGAQRVSGPLVPGSYIVGGSDIRVEASYIQIPGGTAVAGAFAWICYTAATAP